MLEIAKTPLRQPAVKGHLATFKSGANAAAGT
jgi:hypothetical protein